jgi:aryl-alcohol dehydrogenase-like predicted oxidoreductase
VTSTTLRRACKIAPVAAVQTEYSPFVLEVEGTLGSDMLATCRELGVALVPYAPLGRGLLTTTFIKDELVTDKNDVRQVYFPRFQNANRDTNVKLVNKFKSFADKKGCTTSQLALAWLLKQGDNIIPIPGTKKIKYLEENWGTLGFQLTDDEEREIRQFAETAEIAGGRLPPQYEKNILVDTREE